MEIQIGDGSRKIDIEEVKQELLETKQRFDNYAFKKGLDEGETEELKDLLAGEIEICPSCNKWKESSDLTMHLDGEACSTCIEVRYW